MSGCSKQAHSDSADVGLALPRLTLGGKPLMGKRPFLRSLGLTCGAGLLAGAYAWQIEPHWVDWVHRSLPLEGLPESIVGERMVQLSDLHVGPQVKTSYLLSILQKVARIRPRWVLLTGDFVTYDGPWVLEELDRLLGMVSPLGVSVFACLGNHDYGEKWSQTKVADTVSSILARHGIQVLRNQSVISSGLQLIGLEDCWGPGFDAKVALNDRDPTLPGVCLCHNPDGVDDPAFEAFEGWVFSGHTHGGQCRPPFLPPPILPVKNRQYVAGEVSLGTKRRLYINRGLGHLVQARFNARPEVTIWNLMRASGR